MKNNKVLNRIYDLFLFSFIAITLAGCRGGGGSSFGGGSFIGGGDGGSTAMTTFNNPEPSSLLLLGTGLIGMAVYAKARLKSKSKK